MTATTNLNITHVADSENDKYVRVNEGLDALDAAITETLTIDLTSASATPTAAQIRAATVLYVTGCATSGRTVTLPTVKRPITVTADSTNSNTFALVRGATSINFAPDVSRILYMDGTTDGLRILAASGTSAPGAGDLISTNNLSDLDDADTALDNLGGGTGTGGGIEIFKAADNDAVLALLGTGTPDGTTVLYGDGTWGTPGGFTPPIDYTLTANPDAPSIINTGNLAQVAGEDGAVVYRLNFDASPTSGFMGMYGLESADSGATWGFGRLVFYGNTISFFPLDAAGTTFGPGIDASTTYVRIQQTSNTDELSIQVSDTTDSSSAQLPLVGLYADDLTAAPPSDWPHVYQPGYPLYDTDLDRPAWVDAAGTDIAYGALKTDIASVTFGIPVTGKPADGEVLFEVIPRWPLAIAASLTGWSVTSHASVANATGSTVYDVQKNGSSIGTLTIGAGTNTATLAGAGGSFNGTTDALRVVAPATADATHANFTIHGYAVRT